MLQAKITKSSV